MDIKEIQNLIKFVAKSGVNEVAIEQGEFKITIKAEHLNDHVVVQQAPPVVAQPQVVNQPVQTQAAATEAAALCLVCISLVLSALPI